MGGGGQLLFFFLDAGERQPDWRSTQLLTRVPYPCGLAKVGFFSSRFFSCGSILDRACPSVERQNSPRQSRDASQIRLYEVVWMVVQFPPFYFLARYNVEVVVSALPNRRSLRAILERQ